MGRFIQRCVANLHYALWCIAVSIATFILLSTTQTAIENGSKSASADSKEATICTCPPVSVTSSNRRGVIMAYYNGSIITNDRVDNGTLSA